MSQCIICGRNTNDETFLCVYHKTALQNLKDGYTEWKNRASVDWEDYIESIYNLDSLGIWVREIIDLLKSEDVPSGLL